MVGGGRKGKEGKGPKGEGDMKRRISEGRVRVGVRGLSPGSEIVIKVPSLEIEFEFRDTMFVRRIRGPCGVGCRRAPLKGSPRATSVCLQRSRASWQGTKMINVL
jgi:hypothetical protein